MELKAVQLSVDEWIKSYGVKYFHPMTNLGILMEEIGEMARIMTRTYGEQSMKESDKEKNLADEMADVLWVLAALANQCDVNLEEAFENNLRKKTNRDANRHHENEKLKE